MYPFGSCAFHQKLARTSPAQWRKLVDKRLHGFGGHDLAPQNLVHGLDTWRKRPKAQAIRVVLLEAVFHQSAVRKHNAHASAHEIL
jgi:hypothetical protein